MNYQRQVLQVGGEMLVQMTDDLEPEDLIEVADPSCWCGAKHRFICCQSCGTHRAVWEVPAPEWLKSWADQINRDPQRSAKVIQTKKNGHIRLAVWATEANGTRTSV